MNVHPSMHELYPNHHTEMLKLMIYKTDYTPIYQQILLAIIIAHPDSYHSEFTV